MCAGGKGGQKAGMCRGLGSGVSFSIAAMGIAVVGNFLEGSGNVGIAVCACGCVIVTTQRALKLRTARVNKTYLNLACENKS